MRGEVRLAVFLVVLALYLLGYQRAYWSDGHFLIVCLSRGDWRYHHVLYLPLAHAVHATLSVIGLASTETALRCLSALGGAAATALLFQACRICGSSVARSLLLASLAATTPVVWFYSTTIEVHAIQAAFSAALMLWVARAVREPSAPLHAGVLVLLCCGLVGTHLSGVLWGPAVLVFMARERRRFHGWASACVLALVFGVFWRWSSSAHSASATLAAFAMGSLLTPPSLALLTREILRPQGIVFAAGVLAGLIVAGRRRRLDTATVSSAVLFVTTLAFATNVDIDERGAYFIALVPVCVLLLGLALRSAGAWSGALLTLLMVANLALSLREVYLWTKHFPHAEWALPLIDEAQGKGVLLAFDADEWAAVFSHSRLRALCVENRDVVLELDDPGVARAAHNLVAAAVGEGGRIYLTPTFLAAEQHGVPAFLEAIEQRYGTPVPAPGGGSYFVIDPTQGD